MWLKFGTSLLINYNINNTIVAKINKKIPIPHVHCTVYNVYYTVYSEQCILYIVKCIMYIIQCKVYNVYYTV